MDDHNFNSQSEDTTRYGAIQWCLGAAAGCIGAIGIVAMLTAHWAGALIYGGIAAAITWYADTLKP